MTIPTPLVSVIISTYNRSNVLPYSMGTVLRQTLTDFEVLVVGDGCTDDSESVVKAIDDPRVRWVNLPVNTGHQSGPNNEGLRLAQGEFIAYLGHDDLWLPHHLDSLVNALSQGADLAYSVIELVGSDGYLETSPPKFDYTPGMWIPPTSVMHRRSITSFIGGWKDYRELICDPDVELWQRISQSGYKLSFVPRLTAIKFPAAWRRNVYKTNLCEEQATWFARIQAEPDLESVEIMKMLQAQQSIIWDVKPYSQVLINFLRETAERMRLFLRNNIPLSFSADKGKGIQARRRFKGLEPK